MYRGSLGFGTFSWSSFAIFAPFRRQSLLFPNLCNLRNLRMISYSPMAPVFMASSPFSFMISRVISADAYMSFTSSHSFTV